MLTVKQYVMKKNLILLSICIYASISNVMAADVSHYVEFARVYGIVRYFSPNPYTQKWSESDWTKVCALLANRAETQSLEAVFKPLAPSLFFSVVPDTSKEGAAFYNNSPFNYYYYSGSGELDIPFLAKVLSPELAKYIPYYKKLAVSNDSSNSAIVPVDGQYYSYEVSEDKYLNIQHSLQKEMFDSKATERLLKDARKYWDGHKSEDKSLPKRRSVIFGLLSDIAVRVADLTVRWNIVRHFYPYYEEDELDWDCHLKNYMQEAVQMKTVNSFESVLEWYNCICRFFNPIKDGHLFVRNNMVISRMQSTYLPEFYAAVETKLVNDTLLIRKRNDVDEPWRVCNSINSQPASAHMHNCRMITNAATDAHRDQIAAGKLFCASEYNTPFIVESSGLSGDTRLDTLYARLPEEPSFSQQTKPSVQKYDNGILYIDAASSDVNEKRVLSELAPDVKGLFF